MPYIDNRYRPQPSDLLCSYHIEPATGKTVEAVTEELCSKAAIDVSTGPNRERLVAHAYAIDDHNLKVAYPFDHFEPGNIPQMLSV
ncbi:MAG: ribulose-bisphosphate carboxylase large subunit, partial [candidate division KSB1 bacterium]|nr:ribulose-bisphosphate carboxylase large subunit [candidate division KSB1 bacterium]